MGINRHGRWTTDHGHTLNLSYYLKRAILSFVASNQCALTSAVSQIFFTDVSCILIMFRHYFGQEGGRTMVTMFAREAWNGGSLSFANFVNSLTAGGA